MKPGGGRIGARGAGGVPQASSAAFAPCALHCGGLFLPTLDLSVPFRTETEVLGSRDHSSFNSGPASGSNQTPRTDAPGFLGESCKLR